MKIEHFPQSIDLQAETINLAHFEDATVKDLSRLAPKDQGRYHVFKFKHTHEGDYIESIGKSVCLSTLLRVGPESIICE